METVDRIKLGEQTADFKDTTSGFVNKGSIAAGNTGWVEGGAVYNLIYGNNN